MIIEALTFEQAAADLGAALDRAVRDSTPVVVTRNGSEATVILFLAEWNNLQENLHLLSTAANCRALDESIAELNAGLVHRVSGPPEDRSIEVAQCRHHC